MECIPRYGNLLALFPGHSHCQFLIACLIILQAIKNWQWEWEWPENEASNQYNTTMIYRVATTLWSLEFLLVR